ncbi:MAG: TolC family protein, partial [Bacteroidota bacterium]|nr:TolC family protein [Bacteroidota bacterium]
LNVNKEAIIDQENTIRTTKRSLNQLLSRDPDVQYEVIDSIPLNYTPDTSSLANKLYRFNTRILFSQKQNDIARLSLKEYKSSLYPKLNFSAGYNFLYSDNNTSSVILNRSYGPLAGGTLTIPIYQSGNIRRQIQIARIDLQSAQYDLQSTRLQENMELKNALTSFEDQKQLLGIEKNNVILAEENMKISLERLRLGETTSLEVRLAQESLSNSLARLANFEYNLKVAETKLRQLVADL